MPEGGNPPELLARLLRVVDVGKSAVGHLLTIPAFRDILNRRCAWALKVQGEVIPGLRHLAIMANVSSPGAVLEMAEVQAAARMLGLEVSTLEIRRAEDIVPGFDTLKDRAEALYVCTDPLVITALAFTP